jgi:hypothetical protein
MLNVIMLSVVMLSVIMLSVVMLNVIILNVIMLSVVAPIPKKSPGVNFTNILRSALAPKSFRQKNTNPNCKHIKAEQITLV